MPRPPDDDAVVSPTRLETGRAPASTTSWSTSSGCEIAELPEEVCELSPLDRGIARARHARRVPPRGPRRPARPAPVAREPLDRRRPGRLHEIAEQRVRALRGARASPAGGPSGTATGAGSSPTSTASSSTTPSCAPATGSPTLATELRVRPARSRASGGRDRAVRRSRRCASAGRPTASTAARRLALVVDYKTGRPVRRRRRRRSHLGGHEAAAPRVRPRGRAARSATPTAGDRRLLVRHRAGRISLGGSRAPTTSPRPASTTCCG